MKRIVSGCIIAAVMSTSFIAFAATFTDVSTSHWASRTIDWGVSTGVVTGYPDRTFKPEKSVTEEEFLTMLISAYEKRSSLKGAADHWSDPFYYYANEKNFPTEGWDEPTARRWSISRQKVAEIVTGATGMNYSGNDAIKWLLAKGLAKGKSADLSIAGFKGADYLTRAEAVQFIKNAKENGLKELKVRPAQPSDPAAIPPIPGQGQTPNSNTPVTVVQPKNPDMLLPKDTITEPSVQSLLDSLRYNNGALTGVAPTLPEGYMMTLRYKDKSDGKWGDRKNDVDLSHLKAGDPFQIKVTGEGGSLFFAVAKYPELKNSVTVSLPNLKAEWGTKR